MNTQNNGTPQGPLHKEKPRKAVKRTTAPKGLGRKRTASSSNTGSKPPPRMPSGKKMKTQPVVLDQTQLVIKPEFAMALRTKETKDRSILSIGGPGTADWVFNLEDHLTTIHRENPGRDFYIVGYRDEERPNLFDAHKRTNVPFFAVHTLEMGSHAPKTLAVTDGLAKTEEHQSIAISPFKWVQLHTFATGETVHMLQFVGRTTKHSTKDQSGMTCGGQVFFPQRFDSKKNPGDSFEITLAGEVYCFDSEVWGHTKHGLKQALMESPFENWLDCCCRAKKAEILSITVQSALKAFFLVYDDLDQSVHEEAVKRGLSEMFWQFKKEVAASEKLYKQMEASGATAEQAIHFKIYPENEELRKYLMAGKNSRISAWTGKAAAVYPRVEETVAPGGASIWSGSSTVINPHAEEMPSHAEASD